MVVKPNLYYILLPLFTVVLLFQLMQRIGLNGEALFSMVLLLRKIYPPIGVKQRMWYGWQKCPAPDHLRHNLGR